jgi:hypothetical protein
VGGRGGRGQRAGVVAPAATSFDERTDKSTLTQPPCFDLGTPVRSPRARDTRRRHILCHSSSCSSLHAVLAARAFLRHEFDLACHEVCARVCVLVASLGATEEQGQTLRQTRTSSILRINIRTTQRHQFATSAHSRTSMRSLCQCARPRQSHFWCIAPTILNCLMPALHACTVVQGTSHVEMSGPLFVCLALLGTPSAHSFVFSVPVPRACLGPRGALGS